MLIDHIIGREHFMMESMSHLTPMLETYVQNLKPDNELGLVPASDEYFLGRLDFGKKDTGEKLFVEKACITCHVPNGTGRSPSLNGMYGAQVLLADGSTVTADEGYIRESILQPNAKIVAGYLPMMPTFQGQLTEEQILALTAYIKSLQSQPIPAKGAGIAPTRNK